MGAPMANNLRKSGHTVTVWNRTASRAEPLVKKGARSAATPRDAAAGQDLVFLCLSDEKSVDAVLEGPDGALAGLQAGHHRRRHVHRRRPLREVGRGARDGPRVRPSSPRRCSAPSRPPRRPS